MTDDNFDKTADSPAPKGGERPVYRPEKRSDFLEGFMSPEKPDETGAKEADGKSPLADRVIDTIRQIYDPEIPVNIYDLGLIYNIEASDDGFVAVTMTLTTPHCPVAEILPGEVESRVAGVEGVSEARVDVVWDPPWDPSRMSEEAQLELGFI